jgi:hypothetical protein
MIQQSQLSILTLAVASQTRRQLGMILLINDPDLFWQ